MTGLFLGGGLFGPYIHARLAASWVVRWLLSILFLAGNAYLSPLMMTPLPRSVPLPRPSCCWHCSMLEMDELNAVNGVEMPLEIYQKPTDFKKKKLTLLTDKAYYLYVHITRTTD